MAAVGLLALTSMASSADMGARPIYKAAPPPAPAFSWTGFYIGAVAGGGWSTTEASATSIDFGESEQPAVQRIVPFLDSFNIPVAQTQSNGLLAGGTVGYNWQMSPWLVLGVEGDIAWTDIKGTSPCLVLLACSVNHKWMATAAGRVGFTRDRLMVYFKGGAAWADTRYSARFALCDLEDSCETSVKKTRVGALFGTGIEYAFLSNWSAKIEYNYIDFGKKDYGFNIDDEVLVGAAIRERMHVVKGGLNWRFNSPVVGAY